MRAAALWARSTSRRHLLAGLLLTVLLGVVAGTVAASLAAARRSETSLARFLATSHDFHAIVGGCPPGVDPNQLESQQQFLDLCTNPETMERLRREVVAPLPQVADSGLVGVAVVGILQPDGTGGWGHGVLVFDSLTPGVALARPVVVEGRLADPAAADEVMLGERAARAAGIRAGDRVRLASWSQDELDTAVDTGAPPTTAPFESTVVGVVRYLVDVESPGEDGTFLPDAMYAGPAWAAAHHAGLAGYGVNIGVHLRNGAEDLPAVREALDASGWQTSIDPAQDADLAAIRRTLDLERRALLVGSLVAATAGLVLGGLLVLTQLRRELSDGLKLRAIGMSRRDLDLAALLRTLVILVPATVLAIGVATLLSPLGPVGLARRLEFSRPIRVDLPVFVATAAVLGAVAVVLAGLAGRGASAVEARRARPSARVIAAGPCGSSGATFARGSSARIARAVTAVAVGALVAAAVLVGSFDRVLDDPSHYGAWWTVAVGQYSSDESVAAGAARLQANPAVVAAAGVYDTSADDLTVDGLAVPALGYERFVGRPTPVLVSGRAPADDDEVALGTRTSQRLGKHVGDLVHVTAAAAPDQSKEMTVVGVAVLADPVNPSRSAGDGVFLTGALAREVSDSFAQSIVVAIDPAADQGAVLAQLADDFGGSMRAPTPQPDLANLQRLRMVPWLLSAMVVLLALVTLAHALTTLVRRHRLDLAVLQALGMTSRQRRRTGVVTGGVVVLGGVVVGAVVGLVAGRLLWRAIADRAGIPANPTLPLGTVALAALGSLVVAALASLAGVRWQQRLPASRRLRVE